MKKQQQNNNNDSQNSSPDPDPDPDPEPGTFTCFPFYTSTDNFINKDNYYFSLTSNPIFWIMTDPNDLEVSLLFTEDRSVNTIFQAKAYFIFLNHIKPIRNFIQAIHILIYNQQKRKFFKCVVY